MMTRTRKPTQIMVSVFNDGYNCSNGGLSSQHDRLLLISGEYWEGLPEVDRQKLLEGSTPLVKTVSRHLSHGVYIHAEPVTRPEPGNIGWMAGGTFIYSSDGRYSELTGVKYPISLHDRQETPEMNRALSI